LDKHKTRNVAVILVSTFLGAAGQLAFKYALSMNSIYIILIGLVLYGFSTLLYFYVLGRSHLSWAYSMGGLSYIFAVLLAPVLLNESVPPLRWAGVLVITAGVALIGYS
jgi:uncharacterized membrane protein